MNHDEIFKWIEKAPVHKIPRAYGLHKLIRYFSTRKSATIDDFSKYYFQTDFTDFNELRYWDLYELCLLIDQRLLRSNQSRIHNQVNRDSKKHELIDKLKNLQVGNGIEDSVAFYKKLLEKYGQHIDESNPQSEEAYLHKLERDVAASLSDRENRKERLRKALELPEVFSVTTTVYKRNPDVIAEVLDRANGECEECGKPAPFKRASNGSPYIEVHHRVPLSEGGKDTINNALALCPNCHRKAHFG